MQDPQLSIPEPVVLLRPFGLWVRWTSPGESEAEIRAGHEGSLAAFFELCNSGAFAASTPGQAQLPAVQHRVTQVPGELYVELDTFPFEPQALRPLVSSLRYGVVRHGGSPRCSLEAAEEVPVQPGSASVLADCAQLRHPLTPVAANFPVSTQWCRSTAGLEVALRSSEPSARERLDTLVAHWAVLAGAGAFATEKQLDAFDEDEDIQLYLDLVKEGSHFCEWPIVQLGVDDECVTLLVNVVAGFHRSQPIVEGLELA